MENVLQAMHNWVSEYIRTFYSDDIEIQQAILLKEEHTKKVTVISRELAKHLKLSVHDQLLAEMIGLFHDIGRFKQFTLYRTFNDALSENHALLGLKVIEKLDFLKEVSEEDRAILNFAIANHNAKLIAATDNSRQLLFAKIIRDADKLDIYRVLEPFLKPSDGTGCNETFLQSFIHGRQCDYAQIKTYDDRKLVRLMWLYNIYFSWTMLKIVERGYVDKIIECLPKTPLMEQGVKNLKIYIKGKLTE